MCRRCVFRSRRRLVMSGGRRMPNCPASVSKGFSSTPVKTSQGKDFQTSKGLDDGVLSDDEDTFSLLSPIYHDSFDSDEDLEPSLAQQSDNSRLSVSPVRYWSFISSLRYFLNQVKDHRLHDLHRQNLSAICTIAVLFFVIGVSYQKHLQSRCCMLLWSLQAHLLSVHGKCGWWPKPKKTVSNWKRKQRRQATVNEYLHPCVTTVVLAFLSFLCLSIRLVFHIILTHKHTVLLHPVWISE